MLASVEVVAPRRNVDDRRIADRDDRVPHGKLGDSDLVVRSAGVYAMTASPTGMFTA